MVDAEPFRDRALGCQEKAHATPLQTPDHLGSLRAAIANKAHPGDRHPINLDRQRRRRSGNGGAPAQPQ